MTVCGTAGAWAAEKRAVADAAKRLADLGLVSGSSGNVSVRLPSDDSREILAVTRPGSGTRRWTRATSSWPTSSWSRWKATSFHRRSR